MTEEHKPLSPQEIAEIVQGMPSDEWDYDEINAPFYNDPEGRSRGGEGTGFYEVFKHIPPTEEDECEDVVTICERVSKAEAQFIVHARRDIPRLIATIAAKEVEIAALRSEVREWQCESCNTVYPGPPSRGVSCVTCPNCGGLTAPKPWFEKRQLKRTIQERDAAIAAKDAEIAGLRLELDDKDAMMQYPSSSPKGMVMISVEDARECAEQVVFRVSDWRMAAWKWKKIERFDLEDDCTRRADRLAEIRDRLHGALHPETPQETVAILKE